MTPQERQEFNDMKLKVAELLQLKQSMEMSSRFPLLIDQALQGRGFLRQGGEFITSVENGGTGADTLTGIIKGNGNNPLTAITPLATPGDFYVSSTNGGATNVRISYSDGIITAIL